MHVLRLRTQEQTPCGWHRGFLGSSGCASPRPGVAAENPQVVELWPGAVPDETGNLGAERSLMSPRLDRKQVEVTEPTRMVTNVSRPSITIYRPAKDKDTGTAVLVCPGGGYWNLYWQPEQNPVSSATHP